MPHIFDSTNQSRYVEGVVLARFLIKGLRCHFVLHDTFHCCSRVNLSCALQVRIFNLRVQKCENWSKTGRKLVENWLKTG